MSVINTKDLLSQLSQLERSLKKFSFEELSAEEASSLGSSFKDFKELLETKIFDPNARITEVQNEKKLRQPKFTNEQSNNAAHLIAHVSHEIRTPLNGIIGFANLLSEEELRPGQLKKVEAIQSTSYALMEIINEVLEYSKLTSGVDDFNEIDFNFKALVQDVMFLCQTLMLDKNVHLQATIDPEIPHTLLGDPSKLSQILLNLMGNAIKFVEKGHIKLTIDLKQKKGTAYVLNFKVADTGIGISEPQLKTIFESYKQADTSTFSKYGGSGLGLSIVREIIEKQGGHIEVQSELGVGTTFQFTIPFKVGNHLNIPKKGASTINVQKGKELLRGTRFLVFEDNLLNQHLISEQLNKWGCKVHVTADATKGLNILKSHSVDIVLMDLKMPGMSGFEVTEKIRRIDDSRIKTIPIIAISADFTAQDQESCVTSGIDDFILKPYTLDELLLKILKQKREKMLTTESKALLKRKTIVVKRPIEIDLDKVYEDCFGEIEILSELIRLFKQNVFEFIGAVKINLKHNDLKEVSLSAHKLKAGLAMMNAKHLLNLIIAIEASCKNNDEVEVERLYQEFLDAYPGNEKAIDRQLTELKKKI
ncbi:ATP-binding protein [Maribacter aestuarii]|uniref:ATP-binding protein n=1 Tax=Maribacter aestuarii TaxID=1130723 RepID=UPI00248CEC4F|nr:ATP-binding protein [Maribacter aestuarii]